MQYVFNKCNKQSTTLLRDNVLIRTSKSLSYPPFDDNIPFCRTSSRMQGLLLLAVSFNALPDVFHASSLASCQTVRVFGPLVESVYSCCVRVEYLPLKDLLLILRSLTHT
jgi:hypothetical protein